MGLNESSRTRPIYWQGRVPELERQKLSARDDFTEKFFGVFVIGVGKKVRGKLDRMESSLHQTVFMIPKMDCASEETMIRMALEGIQEVRSVSVDLGTRRLTVVHKGSQDNVLKTLSHLGLGAQIKESRELTEMDEALSLNRESDTQTQGRVLKLLLAINGSMFLIELTLGWFAQSAGLIADSLDMFADAAVYSLSLYAVGKTLSLKKKAARLSGYLQLILALGASIEVSRRVIGGSEPEAPMMMGVAFLALIANVTCLFLLARHRDGDVHMKASWIFSTNDVIANCGVILAGLLVHLTQSSAPDLIVGSIITVIVFTGAMRILMISRSVASN